MAYRRRSRRSFSRGRRRGSAGRRRRKHTYRMSRGGIRL